MQMLGDGFPLRQRQGAEVDRTAPDPRVPLPRRCGNVVVAEVTLRTEIPTEQ